MDPFGNHRGDGATCSDAHRNTDPCSRKDRRALADRADTEYRYFKAGRLGVRNVCDDSTDSECRQSPFNPCTPHGCVSPSVTFTPSSAADDTSIWPNPKG